MILGWETGADRELFVVDPDQQTFLVTDAPTEQIAQGLSKFLGDRYITCDFQVQKLPSGSFRLMGRTLDSSFHENSLKMMQGTAAAFVAGVIWSVEHLSASPAGQAA